MNSIKEKILTNSIISSISDIIIQTFISLFGSIFFLICFPFFSLINYFTVKQFPNPKSILITGASSGIGREFALQYASKGTTLFLTGRNKERLDEIAGICTKKGSVVDTTTIDVTDALNLANWINECDKKSPIDLVIANAGITEAMLPCSMTYEEKMLEVNSINVNGVMNTVLPLINPFRERQHGQIVLTGSMASQYPKFLPAYTASKFWILGWANSLRQELRNYGIGVTVLIPGFIKTKMTDNLTNIFFVREPEESIKFFIKEISENKSFSCDNKPTLYLTSFANRIQPNLRDAIVYLQSKFYPESLIDSFQLSSGYKKYK